MTCSLLCLRRHWPSALWVLLFWPLFLAGVLIASGILGWLSVRQNIRLLWQDICNGPLSKPLKSLGRTPKSPSITNAGAPEKSSAGTSKWRR